MGDIVGGILGGIGSIAGAWFNYGAAQNAAQQAMTGYNYLTTGPGKDYITSASAGGTAASQAQRQLLGLEPITPGTANAFTNYLNSTGHQFQLDQGSKAITGSAAARGLLNSGATAKALTEYGQNLATGSFNNYLNQLGALSNQGYNATTAVANAGVQAGSNAAQYTQAAGGAVSSGINGALGQFGGAITNYLARPA